jgi:hypothetical protein
MKHKIYIVHEQVDFMGEIREKIVRASACKRTAKKFIEYKLGKLSALKAKTEFAYTQSPVVNTKNINRINLACQTNYFKLKEMVLYA